MQFKEYEEIISQTAIYPEAGQGTHLSLAYTALGLSGEAGEFSEKIKKWIRDQKPLDCQLAMKELGDVLWYLTAAAREMGYSLQDVAEVNVVKLLSRKKQGMLGGSGDTREVTQES